MKKTALVIMAAGLGRRYGNRIKQLEPVGPNGEIIMDYSIYDALEAGFNKVVFIIRRDLEKDFKEIIGNRIEKLTEVAYAFQEKEDLPEGFCCPEGRIKPWGTGQAVLSCRKLLHEPFVVINADDYYGKEAFVKVHEFLVSEHPETEHLQICMAGFILGNTLSDNGSVTRGICSLNEEGQLVGVHETHHIVKTPQGAAKALADGSMKELNVDSLVSMNMWGLTPAFMEALEKGFVEFLTHIEEGDEQSEYLLPTIIDSLIQKKQVQVSVLPTHDEWFGVTYQEDKQSVKEAFEKLIQDGVYTSPLKR